MKYGPVVLKMKKAAEVTFRSACEEDAAPMIGYLKQVCGETPFLLSGPEEVNYTVEGERAFLKGYEESEHALMLNAYVNGKLVGNASFDAVSRAGRMCHRASLGVAVFREYTGIGIGRTLISILLEEAGRCGFEIMELDVFSGNDRAIALYQKLGFTECGRIVNAVKYPDGSYADEIKMQKFLKKTDPAR